MGATTVWERWDSLLADGSINPGEMTSFNHYALGAVADWLHRTVAGLAPGAPGYRRLRRQARAVALPHLRAAQLRTPYGDAEVAWERADGLLELRVTVPVGARRGRARARARRAGRGPPRAPTSGTSPMSGRRTAEPSTVRDVLDDEHAWKEIVAAAKELSLVSGERQAAGRLKGYLDAPAATLVDALIPPGLVTKTARRAASASHSGVSTGGDPA